MSRLARDWVLDRDDPRLQQLTPSELQTLAFIAWRQNDGDHLRYPHQCFANQAVILDHLAIHERRFRYITRRLQDLGLLLRVKKGNQWVRRNHWTVMHPGITRKDLQPQQMMFPEVGLPFQDAADSPPDSAGSPLANADSAQVKRQRSAGSPPSSAESQAVKRQRSAGSFDETAVREEVKRHGGAESQAVKRHDSADSGRVKRHDSAVSIHDKDIHDKDMIDREVAAAAAEYDSSIRHLAVSLTGIGIMVSPSDLSEPRRILQESGRHLSEYDCRWIADDVRIWLPEEAYGSERRILGAIRHVVGQRVSGVRVLRQGGSHGTSYGTEGHEDRTRPKTAFGGGERSESVI